MQDGNDVVGYYCHVVGVEVVDYGGDGCRIQVMELDLLLQTRVEPGYKRSTAAITASPPCD